MAPRPSAGNAPVKNSGSHSFSDGFAYKPSLGERALFCLLDLRDRAWENGLSFQLTPLTPSEYEMLVEKLVGELDFAKSGKIRRNHKYEGVRQPGLYEVDVAVDVDLADAISFRLIIECKNWKRPVDRPVIQKIAQTRDAISADKAAVVSPLGFTKEAVEVARALGVALWVVTLHEWVIVYANGGVAFRLSEVAADADRDWVKRPAQARLHAWNPYSVQALPKIPDLPEPVSWARFVDVDRWDRDIVEVLAGELVKKLLKRDPGDRGHYKSGGICRDEGDGIFIG